MLISFLSLIYYCLNFNLTFVDLALSSILLLLQIRAVRSYCFFIVFCELLICELLYSFVIDVSFTPIADKQTAVLRNRSRFVTIYFSQRNKKNRIIVRQLTDDNPCNVYGNFFVSLRE